MEGAFKKLNYISKQSYNICEHCLIRNGGGGGGGGGGEGWAKH